MKCPPALIKVNNLAMFWQPWDEYLSIWEIVKHEWWYIWSSSYNNYVVDVALIGHVRRIAGFNRSYPRKWLVEVPFRYVCIHKQSLSPAIDLAYTMHQFHLSLRTTVYSVTAHQVNFIRGTPIAGRAHITLRCRNKRTKHSSKSSTRNPILFVHFFVRKE